MHSYVYRVPDIKKSPTTATKPKMFYGRVFLLKNNTAVAIRTICRFITEEQ